MKLKEVTQAIDLNECDYELIKEIQTILKKINLYRGYIDGLIGNQTRKAFAEFKEKSYLQYPNKLGVTTATTLLEVIEIHPNVIELNVQKPTGPKIKVPKLGVVGINDPILRNGHLTWSEVTKYGTRIPVNSQITDRLLRLAERFEQIRNWFGNTIIVINSGYRDPKSNRAVGGVPNSRHINGEALDIVPSIGLNEGYKILDAKWYGGLGDGRQKGFIHIDTRDYNCRFKY